MDPLRPPAPSPVQERDRYKCVYCGQDGLASIENWHASCIDHFQPRSAGGTDDDSNRVTACHLCNSIKGHSDFGPFSEAVLKKAQEYVLAERAKWEATLAIVRKRVLGKHDEGPEGAVAAGAN